MSNTRKKGKIKKTFLLLGTVPLRVIILLEMMTMNPARVFVLK